MVNQNPGALLWLNNNILGQHHPTLFGSIELNTTEMEQQMKWWDKHWPDVSISQLVYVRGKWIEVQFKLWDTSAGPCKAQVCFPDIKQVLAVKWADQRLPWREIWALGHTLSHASELGFKAPISLGISDKGQRTSETWVRTRSKRAMYIQSAWNNVNKLKH